jgi:hypothetical protein
MSTGWYNSRSRTVAFFGGGGGRGGGGGGLLRAMRWCARNVRVRCAPIRGVTVLTLGLGPAGAYVPVEERGWVEGACRELDQRLHDHDRDRGHDGAALLIPCLIDGPATVHGDGDATLDQQRHDGGVEQVAHGELVKDGEVDLRGGFGRVRNVVEVVATCCLGSWCRISRASRGRTRTLT